MRRVRALRRADAHRDPTTSRGPGTGSERAGRTHAREHNSSTKDVWSAVCSDQLFRLPAIRCAEQWTRRGTRAWRYLFSWRPPGAATGASHSREVPYVFGTVDALPGRMLAGPEPPHELEHAMHRSWIAFARTGDPNHPDLPGWAPYGERRTTLVFERPCRLETDPDAAVRRLWDDD
ncbi:MAG: carboxylesterase family protein [Acidimicrobiia bacterium]|nr:carboxylesterase family protein [Acidimicrobiia bacterium]